MFLITTALGEFWEPDQELLILGAWCLRYDRRAEWETLKFCQVPNPWKDRDRFYQAVRYVDEFGERMLGHLADYLNAVHGVSHSQRYWRIVIGPWLFHYLHVTYDKYSRLREAFNICPNLQTMVLDSRSFQTPRDTHESVNWCLDDPYNLQICSHLLEGMGYSFPTQQANWLNNDSKGEERKWGIDTVSFQGLAKRGISLLEGAVRRVGSKRCQAALCEMDWPTTTLWRLAKRSGFRMLPVNVKPEWTFPAPNPVLDERRNNLASLPTSNEFENIFAHSLPLSFPTLYLEGFQYAREESLRRYGRMPSVVGSATGWYFHEPFKLMAAEAGERTSRLVPVQHGGGYGIFRYSATELHESRVGDAFMVWGWANEQQSSYRNLPSPKLSLLEIRNKNRGLAQREAGRLLYLSIAYLRYLLRFHSSPIGILEEESFSWQARFLEALPSQLRATLFLRDYIDNGVAVRDRLTERFGEIRGDGHRLLNASLRDARLVVVDHSGTAFLESLCSGVPTILFWHPQYSEVRDDAVPYFDRLRKAGILWDSPESAAAKVVEVHADPWKWWESGVVQEARREFANRYALARHDWLDCWVKAFEEESVIKQTSGKVAQGER